jgi:hypothetical protein
VFCTHDVVFLDLSKMIPLSVHSLLGYVAIIEVEENVIVRIIVSAYVSTK